MPQIALEKRCLLDARLQRVEFGPKSVEFGWLSVEFEGYRVELLVGVWNQIKDTGVTTICIEDKDRSS